MNWEAPIKPSLPQDQRVALSIKVRQRLSDSSVADGDEIYQLLEFIYLFVGGRISDAATQDREEEN